MQFNASIYFLFIYYHEYGHLIQFRSKLISSNKQETHEAINNINNQSHIFEFDADAFSSLSLATQIYQYFENNYKRKTQKDFENIIILMLSSILVRILSSPGCGLDFYKEEYSHPHWIVRLFCIANIR